MNIIGIWDGHDSGVALINQDSIIISINEERLTNRKQEVTFPINCLQLINTNANDIAYCTTDFSKTLTRFFPIMKERYYQIRRRKKTLSPFDGFTKSLKYKLTTFGSNVLTKNFSDSFFKAFFQKHNIHFKNIHSFDHHFCHLCSAAYTAGEGDWTVISLDGIGDGRSGVIGELRNGNLKELVSISGESSLGIFFEHITNLMNMRELEDEGKVMALANFSYPVEDTKNPLFGFIWVEGLKIKSKYKTSSMYHPLKKIFQCTPTEQFAYMAQRVLESCITHLIKNSIDHTKIPNIAYSGGIASNIKVNMLVNELDCVKKFHIFPHMGDGGLALGAALALANKKWNKTFFELKNCFLGPEYSNASIEEILKKMNLNYQFYDNIEEKAAELICNDKIVIFHQGRMEYGPRALGNRSILALPNSNKIKNSLNFKLKKRVYYQPFCPSMLEPDAIKMLECNKNFNPYMTIGYRIKPEYKEVLKGVMNVDLTCRPQILKADSTLPIAKVLREVKKRFNFGVVLNTSMNIHGQPLSCTPKDTINVFQAMNTSHAIINKFLISRMK